MPYSTNFGNAAEFAAMLRGHGLEVEFSKYFFCCATGVAGRRPVGGQGASRERQLAGSVCSLPNFYESNADLSGCHRRALLLWRVTAGLQHNT